MFTKIIKRHPLISFFALAYLITWVLEFPAAVLLDWPELLTFLGSFGPGLAAILVAGLIGGQKVVQQLLAPIKNWRVGIKRGFRIILRHVV